MTPSPSEGEAHRDCAAQGIDWHHRLRSLLVNILMRPSLVRFSLGLLAALGITGYQILMVTDLGVYLQGSPLFTGRLLRMLLPCVLEVVTHSLLFFHPGWSVRQEGRGVEGEMAWAAVLGMT